MSKPTCRELPDGGWSNADMDELAARVEAVVVEIEGGQWDDETAESLAARILARLNGVQAERKAQ